MRIQDEIGELIQALGDSSLEKRAAAADQLRAKIKIALPALRKAAAESTDAQIRASAQELVAAFAAGAVLWKHECKHGGTLIQPLRLCGEAKGIAIVICGCVGSPLVGLDAKTGEVRWQSTAGEGFSTYHALTADVVFAVVNTGADKIVAIDVLTGKSLWTLDGKKGLHRPALAGDRVFVGGGDGVRAVDAKTGDVKWHLVSTVWMSTPTVGDSLVIASCSDGKVRAIARGSGKLGWEFAAYGKPGNPSPPAIAGDRVLVGGENCLYSIDLKTGEKAWGCPVKGWAHDSPVAADGIVYYKTSYMGPKDEKSGGYPTMYEHTSVELATGTLVKQQADPIAIPGRGHTWVEAKGQVSAVDGDSKPLKDGTKCALAGCDGVHQLTVKIVRVGQDDVNLFAAVNGRLRITGDSPGGERLIVMAGGFPVYSGRHYDGPRRSAIVCLRAADADR